MAHACHYASKVDTHVQCLNTESGLAAPGIRSWFNVDRENAVGSLKLSLCASVPALHDAHVLATDLVLTLDDFELINDSPIHIRDGDLVWYMEHVYLPPLN
jgi:hypothetical protein